MTDAADVTDADQLFTVAPETFVAARNELVKRLRAAKRRDEAALVAGLRRPSASAWALNQVARQSPGLVAAALDAGRRLRDATEAAVGGDAASLRQAAADDRAATDALVEAAAHLLGRDDARRTMAATVRAAALDDAVADELRRGVLTADHEAAGFGFGVLGSGPPGDTVTAASRRARSTARPAATPEPERSETATDATPAEVQRLERAAQKEAGARQREERRQQAQREAAAARLAKRAARLSRAADEAEARAQEARRDADAATAEAEAAQRALG